MGVHTIYFLGIGGIGMSALARYFVAEGYRVMGYDRTPSPLTSELEALGINIQYDDSLDCAKDLEVQSTIVVRTPAVPEDMPIYVYFREKGFRITKRAEVLGLLTRSKLALCVAGTHGKTTTSTILAHILHGSHVGTNAFLGGIANNYGSNLLLDKQSDYVVVEADEFDRSFHHLSPYISVITSMDPDHLDIYGTQEAYCQSFAYYASLVQHALIVKKNIASRLSPIHHTPSTVHCGSAASTASSARLFTYAVDEQADFYADNVRVQDGEITFDFHTPDERMQDMRLGVPVWVNVENSVAAMAVAWLVGATQQELRQGLSSFTGVYRRFNIHVNTPKVAYIDDYAHHPTELNATIQSVRRLYPERHVIGVFQPHLFSRTRDFADDFAAVLSQLDEVVLLPIYPARELPIEGVNSDWLLTLITNQREGISAQVVEKENLANYLRTRANALDRPSVVMTMGAGDIDRCVASIKEQLILNSI